MANITISQVAESTPFDNSTSEFISDNVQTVILEFKLNYLIAMINNSARLIKTQRITAGLELRGHIK